jgi:hypothetical protein
MQHRLGTAIVMAGSLIGCATTQPPPVGPTTQAAPAPYRSSQRLQTTISPRTAADCIVGVFSEMGFGGFHENGGRSSQPILSAGDYFSARINAISAEEQRLTVTCKWLGEDNTEITVESDLPEDKNAFVVKRIQSVIKYREKPVTIER